MEVDTGASRSIMSESKFTSIFPPRKALALWSESTDLVYVLKALEQFVTRIKLETLNYFNMNSKDIVMVFRDAKGAYTNT